MNLGNEYITTKIQGIIIFSLFQDCTGKVVLSSSAHTYKVAIYSNNLRNNKRKKRKIKARKNGYLIKFEEVTFTGNCCWKVRDRFTGGQSFYMPTVGTHLPGWPIRAVQLVEHCTLKWNRKFQRVQEIIVIRFLFCIFFLIINNGLQLITYVNSFFL